MATVPGLAKLIQSSLWDALALEDQRQEIRERIHAAIQAATLIEGRCRGCGK